MADLKPGWRRVKFGDVVRQVKTKSDPKTSGLERYVAGEHMDTDDLRIRRWGEIGDGYLGPAFHMRFKPGQVLYGSRRTYLRKVAVADFEGICANTTFVLESADPTKLLPPFLPFVMQTEGFNEHSKRESKGSVNPYVNFSDLAWYEFALPPPEEQHQIAHLLNQSRDVLDALRDGVNASRQVYESALAHLFVRTVSEPGIAPSSWATAGWSCKRLEDVCDPAAPISYGIVQPGLSTPGGVPTVTSNNLNIGFTSGVHLTPHGIEASYARSRIRGGDVLITVKGFGTGNIGQVPEFFSGNITRDVARVRFLRSDDAVYFMHLWRCHAFERYWRALSVGTTRPELSIGKLRDMEIPWPLEVTRGLVGGRLTVLLDAVAAQSSRLERAFAVHGKLLCQTLPSVWGGRAA